MLTATLVGWTPTQAACSTSFRHLHTALPSSLVSVPSIHHLSITTLPSVPSVHHLSIGPLSCPLTTCPSAYCPLSHLFTTCPSALCPIRSPPVHQPSVPSTDHLSISTLPSSLVSVLSVHHLSVSTGRPHPKGSRLGCIIGRGLLWVCWPCPAGRTLKERDRVWMSAGPPRPGQLQYHEEDSVQQTLTQTLCLSVSLSHTHTFPSAHTVFERGGGGGAGKETNS